MLTDKEYLDLIIEQKTQNSLRYKLGHKLRVLQFKLVADYETQSYGAMQLPRPKVSTLVHIRMNPYNPISYLCALIILVITFIGVTLGYLLGLWDSIKLIYRESFNWH